MTGFRATGANICVWILIVIRMTSSAPLARTFVSGSLIVIRMTSFRATGANIYVWILIVIRMTTFRATGASSGQLVMTVSPRGVVCSLSGSTVRIKLWMGEV